MQYISIDQLDAVTGGKNTHAQPSQPKQPTTSRPSLSTIGGEALSGCLTGAGDSLGKAKRPQDVAVGCALGAGKSILGSLGKMFGH